eukprot:scaffold319262_cov31-Tisochrysis_lutea.AAC.1
MLRRPGGALGLTWGQGLMAGKTNPPKACASSGLRRCARPVFALHGGKERGHRLRRVGESCPVLFCSVGRATTEP